MRDRLLTCLTILLVVVCSSCGVKQTGESTLTGAPESTNSNTDIIQQAEQLIEERYYPQAIGLLSSVNEDETATSLLKKLRYIINGKNMVRVDGGVAAINCDGQVTFALANGSLEYYGYEAVPDWCFVTSLSFGNGILFAFNEHGDLFTTTGVDGNGKTHPLYTILEAYRELVSSSSLRINEISTATYGDIAILTRDGRVIASSKSLVDGDEELAGISALSEVVDIYMDSTSLYALKNDGTISVFFWGAASGTNMAQEVAAWTDIVAMTCCVNGPIVGLKTDGTVVRTSSYYRADAFYDVSEWEDIISISHGGEYILGLKRDGTVVSTGNDRTTGKPYIDTGSWKDIVAIASAGTYSDAYAFGLTKNGTLVVAGQEGKMPDVTGIQNLYIP